MNKESPQTSPNAGYSLDTSPPPSLILSLSEADYAPLATELTSASEASIPSISTYPDLYSSKQKAAWSDPIEQSSSSSSSNIPMSIFDLSSKLTTTQPSSSEKDIALGRLEMPLGGMSASQYQLTGSRDYNGPLSKKATKADTHDEGKAPLAQLPWAAVEAMSRVQLYGHKKYKDFHNYRKGMEVSRNLSCALRHIKEYMEGHDVDVESGESPLAHAMTRVAFVLQNIHDGTAVDDRYKK